MTDMSKKMITFVLTFIITYSTFYSILANFLSLFLFCFHESEFTYSDIHPGVHDGHISGLILTVET